MNDDYNQRAYKLNQRMLEFLKLRSELVGCRIVDIGSVMEQHAGAIVIAPRLVLESMDGKSHYQLVAWGDGGFRHAGCFQFSPTKPPVFDNDR